MNGNKLIWVIMLAGWTLAVSLGAVAYNGLQADIDEIKQFQIQLDGTMRMFINEQMQRRGAADARAEESRRRLTDLEDKFYQRRGR